MQQPKRVSRVNPIGPVKPVVAGTDDVGTKIYSNATNLVRKGDPANTPLSYGKYDRLGLFEEGPLRDGTRTFRYRQNVARPYNDEAIKANVLNAVREANPDDTIEFAYGGEINPINSVY